MLSFFFSKFALFIHLGAPNTIHFHLYIFMFLHDLINLPEKCSCYDLIPNPRIYNLRQWTLTRDTCWPSGYLQEVLTREIVGGNSLYREAVIYLQITSWDTWRCAPVPEGSRWYLSTRHVHDTVLIAGISTKRNMVPCIKGGTQDKHIWKQHPAANIWMPIGNGKKYMKKFCTVHVK